MKVIKKAVNGKIELSFDDYPKIDFFNDLCINVHFNTDEINFTAYYDEAMCYHDCDKITHGDITVLTEPFDKNMPTCKIAEIIKGRYQSYINQYNKIKYIDIVEFEI